MIAIPSEYIVEKFFEYVYQPRYNKYNNTYQGGCCICKEGGSLGKKRRCYYIPKNDNIFCHNCGWSSKPFKWVKEVTGKTDIDIINDIKEYDTTTAAPIHIPTEISPKQQSKTLPDDCINLFDPTQLNFYKENLIVQSCIKIIQHRRLDTAINRPEKLFISLTDTVHKNRLIIPFINESNEIEFYQSRSITTQDIKTRPKYISRINAEKTLFNINKISGEYNYVFIFEGPLNAFFTRNSVAVAGITERGQTSFTKRQQEQIDSVLAWYKKVWVLDSQWLDNASLSKTEILLKNNEAVFIWPEQIGTKYKDFNDLCIAGKRDEITHGFILKNTFSGLEGVFRLANIKNKR
jgi:hypothetical protein